MFADKIKEIGWEGGYHNFKKAFSPLEVVGSLYQNTRKGLINLS